MERIITGRKGMSLLVKLSGFSALFLLLAIVVFSVISVRSVQTSSMETAVIMGKDKLTSDMMHFEDVIEKEYGRLQLQNGKLVGQQGVSLEYRYELVDEMNSALDIVATIFIREGDQYRRISTNITDGSGGRAVDTFLDTGSATYSSIQSGNDYSGNAVILGRDYLTRYRPIFAPNTRDVIGILFIGIEMTKISNEIAQNTVRQVIMIFIIATAILVVLITANILILNGILVSPIRSVTAMIRRLSLGDINLNIEECRKHDEIGTMKNELRNLLDGLKRTAHFAQNIGNGNLDAPFQPLSNEDVLGNSLLEMRQSLQNAEKMQATQAKIEQQRNWSNEGLAKFAEILRKDNNNMEALSYNVISNMVKYLDINQGGIFVLNEAEKEEDRVLEMKACFAYDRKKFQEKQITPGEGLVGSCFVEGEQIYLTDIPDDYVSITSGLGAAAPSALLLCPLKINDEVYGVIELASFSPFEPYQLEFVQKISESIASTIFTVREHLHTDRLLQQTKLQAEEMANVEEELRQNMEEMQATQEEMRRREAELLETIEELKKGQTGEEEVEY